MRFDGGIFYMKLIKNDEINNNNLEEKENITEEIK